MAHVDTVFDDVSAPEITRDADDLVGPGIGDNAAAVIALVSVLESLGGLPPGVAIAFTVGEEGLGNLRGARHACERLRPTWALAVEGHGLDSVVTNHVGSVRARIEVNGPGGHSWWDRGIPSAIHALAELAAPLARAGANIGAIAGGGAVNAIAAHADMLVELRSLEQDDLTAFSSELEALTVAEPLRLTHEIVGIRPAGRTPPEHALVQRILAERRTLGLPERCESGSTDANAAAALGIPAAAIGCGRGTGMHTTQERISIPSLELGCRQLAAVLPALTRAVGSEEPDLSLKPPIDAVGSVRP
jgi:acetylornithine deacetylase/succinyl-diaminopimelate desuccinylase-like protein